MPPLQRPTAKIRRVRVGVGVGGSLSMSVGVGVGIAVGRKGVESEKELR